MLQRIFTALDIQTSGYRPKSLATDLVLGVIPGVNYILWGYAFAALIFTGSLAAYLPLAVSLMLVSCALVAFAVALTSTFPVNVAGNEEQAVAILATVSIVINARMTEFSGPDAAAATMFVIMALSAIMVGLSFHLAARFKLGPLIQLMPFPVVCGFLAGTGWLFFAAGISMMTGIHVDLGHLAPLFSNEAMSRWLIALACGLAVYIAIMVKNHFLTLPIALLACAAGFHAFVLLLKIPAETLIEGGWLFHFDVADGTKGLADLDFSGVNLGFVASAMPEIGTIVLLSILTASFALSAMELGAGSPLDLDVELRGHGTANVVSGMVLGVPGSTDVAQSIMLWRMGGRSRLLPAVCGLLCLTAAILGGGFIEFVPKIVMGALVFMVAIQFIHEWLFVACKHMQREDIAIVWLIFSVIIVFGFIVGVVVGIALTSLLFLIQYSKINVIESALSLNQMTSPVERSLAERRFINEHARNVRVFNLRGYLFFGSANLLFEQIKEISHGETGYSFFVFHFRRVTGIDSTAVQVFVKLCSLIESKRIECVFCGLDKQVMRAFTVANVFASRQLLVLDDLDAALTHVEDQLLANMPRAECRHVVAILADILGDDKRAAQMAGSMERLNLDAGKYLFEQNSIDTSIYVIESGVVEVRRETPDGRTVRLREFRQGAFVGEMAAYSTSGMRSASALVTETAVIYRLMPEDLQWQGEAFLEYGAILHEMVARLLAARLDFMNLRVEMGS